MSDSYLIDFYFALCLFILILGCVLILIANNPSCLISETVECDIVQLEVSNDSLFVRLSVSNNQNRKDIFRKIIRRDSNFLEKKKLIEQIREDKEITIYRLKFFPKLFITDLDSLNDLKTVGRVMIIFPILMFLVSQFINK